jgi:hypothetical protein
MVHAELCVVLARVGAKFDLRKEEKSPAGQGMSQQETLTVDFGGFEAPGRDLVLEEQVKFSV